MPPANYPATATENDLNTEKCVQFFALGFFGRYKEEYLLTRPASKVLMPMGEAGEGREKVDYNMQTAAVVAKGEVLIFYLF